MHSLCYPSQIKDLAPKISHYFRVRKTKAWYSPLRNLPTLCCPPPRNQLLATPRYNLFVLRIIHSSLVCLGNLPTQTFTAYIAFPPKTSLFDNPLHPTSNPPTPQCRASPLTGALKSPILYPPPYSSQPTLRLLPPFFLNLSFAKPSHIEAFLFTQFFFNPRFIFLYYNLFEPFFSAHFF
ncbi:unnamed protein product [Lactuca virosa]|uniref:Uncharacterized protein n=1 Tax=Lactuca virosa TaxID=75947 RepID=A0AAU9NJG4_9ASTR|nr:unnamed protein product [Lactuca virosa]